eukprot:COSAG02_NODE_1650_length_11487_cov_13.602895_2_plen_74_part_00
MNTYGSIGILVIAQTGSLVLGLLGMLHIMLSFTLAYFVYGVFLGFHWFPFLNLLGCELSCVTFTHNPGNTQTV